MIDHDRLFKQLLSTFFLEFLQLFAPELARNVQSGSIVFLEKEHFTDAIGGRHHVVDLLARVRLRKVVGHVLIHVESQADANGLSDFPRRMFRYFAALESRHGQPIYPVAVLSFDRPRRRCPEAFEMRLPGLDVLRFHFRQVQLNRLPWRDYLRHPNPIAVALMSRMNIEPGTRWRVKLECLKLLVRLRLDRAKSRLVTTFLDTYLRLPAGERRLFAKELKTMPAHVRGEVLELTTSWKEEGLRQGRKEQAAAMIVRQLRRRFGAVPAPLVKRVQRLALKKLEQLGEDLLDFGSLTDLELWIQRSR
jgi:uncharacterized protein DUF4351